MSCRVGSGVLKWVLPHSEATSWPRYATHAWPLYDTLFRARCVSVHGTKRTNITLKKRFLSKNAQLE